MPVNAKFVPKPSMIETSVSRVGSSPIPTTFESLAVEEPLEIRVEMGPEAQRERRSLSITMRTPGHDFELAAGFLFTEGLLQNRSQVLNIEHCGPSGNVVRLDLNPDVKIDLQKMQRNFYTTSSCGVCGKSSLEALRTTLPFYDLQTQNKLEILENQIHRLPEILRKEQGIFSSTGGLHACALFSASGEILQSREDVGRHNALDKLIGWAFLQGLLPLKNSVLLVSGRASFELLQKAAMAGLQIFAAVGAPSSLALELAKEQNITLLGFVRDQRFNIYSNPQRIRLS